MPRPPVRRTDPLSSARGGRPSVPRPRVPRAGTPHDAGELAGLRCLVLGDVSVDTRVDGSAAPPSHGISAPVLASRGEHRVLGGAARVAAAIASLGPRCTLLSVTGRDDRRLVLDGLLELEPNVDAVLADVEGRRTHSVLHLLTEGEELLRVVDRDAGPVPDREEEVLLAFLEEHLDAHDVVVIVDTGDGAISDRVVDVGVGLARASGVPVVTGPTAPGRGGRLDGAVLVQDALLLGLTGDEARLDDAAAGAALRLSDAAGGAAVLLTRGPHGMTLVEPGWPPAHLDRGSAPSGAAPSSAAVLAGLAAALATGLPFDCSARVAALLADVTGLPRDLIPLEAEAVAGPLLDGGPAGRTSNVFTSLAELSAHVSRRTPRSRIGFTNGVFDLLHPGHLSSLREARSHCGFLVVGVNSDASVKRLKGEGRPINDQHHRAEVLAALEVVDAVYIFEEDTPLEVLRALRPDVFVKGADYALEQVVGRDLVESYGGVVVLSDYVDGLSSSRIIARARESASSAAVS